MVNVKKGTAHSLQQSDKVGKIKASEAVVAGMLVRLTTAGEVEQGISAAGGADLLGIAIQNQTDADVIAWGKIGFYQLDGNSVLETDQANETITATNYPVGAPVYGIVNSGLVSNTTPGSGAKVIGTVDGIRNLPSTKSVTQSYVDLDGNTVSRTDTIQTQIPFLGIKLGSV